MMLAERLHGRPIPIPAPPYRMRRGSSGRQSFQAYSNPRTPYRMRPRGVARDRHGGRIPIPTSLRDATRPRPPPATTSTHSNPHIPTGCDGVVFAAMPYESIPIPTSLRDATYATKFTCKNLQYSHPHIPTGCDRTSAGRAFRGSDSNPHIPTGCDRNNYCMNPPRPTTSRTKREPQPSHRTKAAPQLPNHGANLVREACLPRVRAPKRDAPGWSAGRARIFPRSRFTPPASSASVARSTHRRTPRTSTGSSRCSRCASS